MKTVLTTTGHAKTTTALASRGPQGVPGPPGPSGASVTRTADVALSGHRAVRASSASTVALCDAATPSHASSFLGITAGAASMGAPATVQAEGDMVEPSWAWTAGAPVFVGAAGVLTQTAPASGFVLVVGFATSPTALWIRPTPPIYL